MLQPLSKALSKAQRSIIFFDFNGAPPACSMGIGHGQSMLHYDLQETTLSRLKHPIFCLRLVLQPKIVFTSDRALLLNLQWRFY